jgi:integrase
MTWSDVDLETGVWRKPPSFTKTDRAHHVPLSPGAVVLLAGLARTGPRVFDGTSKNKLQRRWAAVRDEAGLAGVRVHDIRHSFASMLATSGVSLQIIGRLVGHSQISTTQRYAHLEDQALREATQKVDDALNNVRPLRKSA